MLPGSIRGKLLALVLAAALPFLALVGGGLWSEWRDTKATAKERALNDARVLAVQVDDHIGNVEHLLAGLSRAVSSDTADVSRNDALFHQVRRELPDFISGVSLFSLAGDNIGSSWSINQRTNISDRVEFQAILGGQLLALGEVHVGRTTGQWVVNIARRVEDQTGRVRAVLVMGTRLAHFQDALRMQALPPGAIVRIVNERGVVVAHSVNGPNWIGRDLAGSDVVARQIAAQEGSEEAVWSDGIARFTGYSTAHRAPWLVAVGLPK